MNIIGPIIYFISGWVVGFCVCKLTTKEKETPKA